MPFTWAVVRLLRSHREPGDHALTQSTGVNLQGLCAGRVGGFKTGRIQGKVPAQGHLVTHYCSGWRRGVVIAGGEERP